jgi:ABC-2 type transport system permease protein
MKAYISVFKLRLTYGLQYRTAALAGVATQFFWGFIIIMVFEAFYSGTTAPPPISLEQLITYVWLQQAFLSFVMLWFRDNELFGLITTGNIAYELCRPSGIYGFMVCQAYCTATLERDFEKHPCTLRRFFSA